MGDDIRHGTPVDLIVLGTTPIAGRDIEFTLGSIRRFILGQNFFTDGTFDILIPFTNQLVLGGRQVRVEPKFIEIIHQASGTSNSYQNPDFDNFDFQFWSLQRGFGNSILSYVTHMTSSQRPQNTCLSSVIRLNIR